jgi:hypothetical protein
MSGTISLSPTVRWSAASWLFDWVLSTLADSVQDPELSSELTEVVDQNIGWFGLEELKKDQVVEVRRLLTAALRPVAEQTFPVEMLGREAALSLLDELSNLASDTS